MKEIIGYEDNKPIYKDHGPARVIGVSGVSTKAKIKQTKEMARLIEKFEASKAPAAYWEKVKAKQLGRKKVTLSDKKWKEGVQ